MRSVAWISVVACLSAAGCFTPDLPDGKLECSSNPARACPSGFYCIDGTCWHNGHAPPNGDMALDLSTSDLSTSDLSATRDLSVASDLSVGVVPDLSPSVDLFGDDLVPPPCPILYVSPNGADTNSGCSETSPKKTITAAFAVGRASGGMVTQIEVCAGDYKETPLTLDFPASLIGAYSCTDWSRTANYGYPTFDGVNQTTIEDAKPQSNAVTLTIQGSSIVSTVVVSGFQIEGPSSGTSTKDPTGLLIQNSAAPTVRNNLILGGGLTSGASRGIAIGSSASPIITKNSIDGGSSSLASPGPASFGIYVGGDSGPVTIVDNTIGGGSGTNTVGSGPNGISINGTLSAPPTHTIRSNIITAWSGPPMTGSTASATAVIVGGNANAVIDSNAVDGGRCTGGPNCPVAISGSTTGSLTISNNRIYAGDCTTGSSSAPTGILLGNVQSPLVYNNMVHGGTSTSGAEAAAINIHGGDSAVIEHNTVVAGSVAGTGAAALWIEAGTTNAQIVNNILSGGINGTVGNYGLLLSVCSSNTGAGMKSFANNLIFGTSLGLLGYAQQNGSCLGASNASTIAQLNASLHANQSRATTVSGNVTVSSSCSDAAPTCTTLPGCTTSAQACLDTIFAGWDNTSIGKSNLFPPTLFAGMCPAATPTSGNGWTLSTNTPCVVTRSSVNDSGTVGLGVDLYGNCRSTTPSMGAEEDSTGVCQTAPSPSPTPAARPFSGGW